MSSWPWTSRSPPTGSSWRARSAGGLPFPPTIAQIDSTRALEQCHRGHQPHSVKPQREIPRVEAGLKHRCSLRKHLRWKPPEVTAPPTAPIGPRAGDQGARCQGKVAHDYLKGHKQCYFCPDPKTNEATPETSLRGSVLPKDAYNLTAPSLPSEHGSLAPLLYIF